jgi:hypothetical protein
MSKSLLPALALVCAVYLPLRAAAEEPAEGRVKLSIRATSPIGGKLSFTWRQLPNEAPRVKIADPHAARLEDGKWVSETYFIPTETGEYLFEVTVRNEAGEESKKTFKQPVELQAGPPVANAGPDQDGRKAGDIIRVDGSASSAAKGRTIAQWDWRVLKAPGDFRPDPKLLKERRFEFKADEPGEYQFELRVSDGTRWSEPSRTTVRVGAPTPPPVAVAGKAQSAKAGETVKVDGSASKAAPGQAIAEWEWRIVQAPDGFKLDRKLLKASAFEFEARDSGTYQFELRVFDGKQWSEPSRTTVAVAAPVPLPVANAGADQAVTAGDTVRLDGSASKAAAGQTIVEWEWKALKAPGDFKLDENLAKKRVIEFKAVDAGEYQFVLRVSDGERWSDAARTAVTVAKPLPPPVAVAGNDQAKTVGEKVRLNGVESKAADGRDITEWEWSVLEAPPGFKPEKKRLQERAWDFKAEHAGTYKFQLRVSDGGRWSEPSVVTVTITPGKPPVVEPLEPAATVELPPKPPVVEPRKPEIKAVAAPGGTLKVGETIVLDGSKSVVDAGLKPSFVWRQEDTKGPVARRLTPDKAKPFSPAGETDEFNFPVWRCTPEEAGTYRFVLEISSRTGAPVKAESDPVTFTVEPAAGVVLPPPVVPDKPPEGGLVAKIGAPRVQVEAGDMVRLDASGSTGPAGAKLEYVWCPVPGKRYPKTWSGTEGPQVEFKAEEEGEYVVGLMVKDPAKNELSAPAQIAIKVGAANQPPAVKVPKAFECVVGDQLRIEAEATDPENDRVEYRWTCMDPPDLVIPDKLATNSILVFVPRKLGTYVFKVTVTDAAGRSASAQTMVGVKDALNRVPTAILDGPSKPVAPGTRVKLSGERSSDPEGRPMIYFWKQESGPGDVKVPGSVPGEKSKLWEFTPTDPGKYAFTLVVSDGVNKSEPEKFELTVSKGSNPPAANIVGPAGGRMTVGEQATLDGTTSSDPENDKLTYKWRKLDESELRLNKNTKAAQIELLNATQEKATLKAASPGVARIELIVNDGASDSEPAYLNLIVGRPNNRPVAKITGPDAARVGETLDLSAEESTDPDGDELTTFSWSQPEDANPTIGIRGKDLRKKTLRFRAERPGTYVVNLEVVDAEGLKSEPVTHKVEVKGVNKPPIAVASRVGDEQAAAGAEVKLTSRGSRDPEDAALKFRWKQISGEVSPPFSAEQPTAEGEVINVVPKAAGEYLFELTANDGELDSAPARVGFSVKAPNRKPVAVIADVAGCEPGDKIVLDGSASTDADNDKLEYRWSQTGDAEPRAKFPWRGAGRAKTEAVLPKDGEYIFELKVYDGKEWSEPRTITVKTRAANVAPVAAFTVAELRAEENAETVLDASASTDPDKGPEPLHYSFKQLGGPKVDLVIAGPRATFKPHKAGTLVFQLKVSDGKAESASVEARVEVLKAGALPIAVPEAKPNPLKVARRGDPNDPNILELNGLKSKPGAAASAAAPGGKAELTYQWKQITGEDLRLQPSALAKARVGLRVFLPGQYRFMLTVNDGLNRSAPAFVDVQVNDPTASTPPPPPPPAPKPEEKNTGDAKPEARLVLPPPKDAATDTSANAVDSTTDPKLRALLDLAKTPGDDAQARLLSALADNDKDVRSTAAVALYRRGASSIPALITVLEDGTPAARKEAWWALKELTHQPLPNDPVKWKDWWAKEKKAPTASTPGK